MFGPCAAPEPHAHDYACDVTVRGPIDPSTGMIVELGLLDRILDDQVVRPFEGCTLNEAVPEFAPGRLIPTCEELARIVAQRIGAALALSAPAILVDAVRIAEDDSLSATWSPEG